jgi:phosphoribosylaminoimidazolecarboxamide formyltransferase / IMP cyclohydrolase
MRALISVSNKTGVVEFARGLAARGCSLVSTGGTARALKEAGLSVLQVSEVTGAPEMMDGRVKTLHPSVHGGILARRDHAGDRAALDKFGITPIDIVAVNLYPFRETAANPATTFDDLIEDIDIGGPSMIRGAAKNFKDVLVVTEPADYARVIAALDEPGGPPMALRFDLARKAFAHTASYDTAIANELEHVDVQDGACARAAERAALPASLYVATRKLRTLRYGENPHQMAAWYVPSDLGEGQGALVHEPARCRRGVPDRDRVPGACRGRHQAHEPLWYRDRSDARGGVRPRPRRRRALRVRRHCRLQPRDRRGDGEGDRVDVHRSGDRAVDYR